MQNFSAATANVVPIARFVGRATVRDAAHRRASDEVIAAARAYIVKGRSIVPVAGKIPVAKNWRRHFSEAEIMASLNGNGCTGIGFLGGDLNHNIVPLDFDTEAGEAWWREQCDVVGIDASDF